RYLLSAMPQSLSHRASITSATYVGGCCHKSRQEPRKWLSFSCKRSPCRELTSPTAGLRSASSILRRPSSPWMETPNGLYLFPNQSLRLPRLVCAVDTSPRRCCAEQRNPDEDLDSVHSKIARTRRRRLLQVSFVPTIRVSVSSSASCVNPHVDPRNWRRW